MKVCFIGLGSIGKKHLNNFIAISKEYNLDTEIHAFRSTNQRLDDEIAKHITYQHRKLEHLADDYDIVFINNPTHLHYETIEYMVPKTKHMFIEKPLFDNTSYDVSDLKLNESSIYYVAAPLRYSGVMKGLKKIIFNEEIYSIRSICSSYLPDWRSGMDYRKVYSSHAEQGGGVSLDLIHEWDYIINLFGFPEKVYNLKGKVSYLEIDSDDISVYLGKYKNKIVEVHLNYFGKYSKRQIELITKEGTILGDFINNTIKYYYKDKIMNISVTKEDMYINEMKYFINSILDGKRFNEIPNAFKVLQIAKGE